MSGRPKVSVIIPVYNVAPYLSMCMESCMDQTLFDIEIIAVDDGSTDGSGRMLDEYRERDPRIRVIHKENGGLSSARNAGLRAAQGEWIVFLDSDDCLSDDACERIWREANEGPTDIIVFGTEIFPEYPRANGWYYSVLKEHDHRVHGFSPKMFFFTPGTMPFVWREAFSKKILDDTGVVFDESLRYGEDLIFQCQVFPFAQETAYIEDDLYHYRWIRPGSLMENINDDYAAKIRKHLPMARIITEYWKEKGLLDQYGGDYYMWVLDFLTQELRKVKDRDKRKEVAGEIRKTLSRYGLEKYRFRIHPSQWKNYVKKMLVLNGAG